MHGVILLNHFFSLTLFFAFTCQNLNCIDKKHSYNEIEKLKEYTDNKELLSIFESLFFNIEECEVAIQKNQFTIFIHHIEAIFSQLMNSSNIFEKYLYQPQPQIFYDLLARAIIYFNKSIEKISDHSIDLSDLKNHLNEKKLRSNNPMFFLIFDIVSQATKAVIKKPILLKSYSLLSEELGKGKSIINIFVTFSFEKNFLAMKKTQSQNSIFFKKHLNRFNEQEQKSISIIPNNLNATSDNQNNFENRKIKKNIQENQTSTSQKDSNNIQNTHVVFSSPLLSEKLKTKIDESKSEDLSKTPVQLNPINEITSNEISSPTNQNIQQQFGYPQIDNVVDTNLQNFSQNIVYDNNNLSNIDVLHQAAMQNPLFIENIYSYINFPSQEFSNFSEILVKDLIPIVKNIHDQSQDIEIIQKCKNIINTIEQATINFKIANENFDQNISLGMLVPFTTSGQPLQ